MKIREANNKDAGVLKELFAESLKFEKKFNADIDLEGGIKYFRKEFKKLRRDAKYFVAEEDGKIVGFIEGKIEKKSRFYKSRKIGAIYDLFVDEKYRNRGIGTELIKAFVYWLKTKKVRIVELDVSPENKTAIMLYKSIGFKESSVQMIKKI